MSGKNEQMASSKTANFKPDCGKVRHKISFFKHKKTPDLNIGCFLINFYFPKRGIIKSSVNSNHT